MRLLALLLLLASGAVAAQPTTLDVEFLNVLLGIESAEDITAGTAPEALAAFFPDDATVIGSIRRRGGDSFAIAFARVGMAPNVAAETFATRSFPGYRHVDAFQNKEPEGGFTVASAARQSFTLYATDDSDRVTAVEFTERSRGGSYVMVHKRQRYGFERMSSASSDEWERPTDPLKASLPVLYPPPGATQQPTGEGGSDDRYTGKAQLTSDLPVAAVAAHYVALMEAGGWAPFGETVSEMQAASGWVKEQDGDRLTALFQVARSDNGSDLLSVSVNNGDKD